MTSVDELERLVKLKESGALTEEEFQAQKAKMIGGSTEAVAPQSDGSLWNPNAAANWSVIFSPVFGSYLHAKNWESLGQKDKAKNSMLWVYAGIAVIALSIFYKPEMAMGAGFVFLLAWYFLSAKPQVQYVKEKLNNQYVKKGWRTPILYAIGALIALATASVMFSEGAFDSKAVAMVKGGKMQMCELHTVEQMVNGFMGNPSWESGTGEGGVQYVNVRGDITLHDKPVRALVQFKVDEAAGKFEYNAFETNEIAQNNLLAMALLKKMCDGATKN